MRQPSDLHEYQRKATEFQCVNNRSMLWLDPGLGKTVTTLTSINYLLQVGYLNAVLIVAPIRVCRLVWRQEAANWSHTKDLTFSLVMGDKEQRTRALLRPANCYVINYENMRWLSEAINTYYVSKGRPPPFDGIVWDEVSKMKNSSTDRVKSIRKIIPSMKWITGLTGTPASNGFKDLHGQFLVVDNGKRLGESKTRFLTQWYKKTDDNSRKLIPYRDTLEGIKEAIHDITLEMSAADYLKMPDFVVNDVMVDLDDDTRLKYEALEKEFFLRLDNGVEKEVFNQASLTNTCLQFSNGAIYPVAGAPEWERVHDAKLDALEDLIDEAAGQPILLAYAYRSDAARIMDKFKKLRPINLTECKTERELSNAMARWRSDDCPLMIAHPASAGHGIDGLQGNGNTLVWFGLNWSLELVTQFNGRIHRQGQGKPVICHRILCRDTLDQAQTDAIAEKAVTQEGLRQAIKKYRENKSKNP